MRGQFFSNEFCRVRRVRQPIQSTVIEESILTATYTFDVFSSLDGFGSYDTKSGNWGGYWGKQGPELLDHRLALYGAELGLAVGGLA